MSSENTPPSESNGSATPFKVSFGAAGLGKKKVPLVTKTKVAAFGHSEDKDQPAYKDELITGFDGNKIISLNPVEEAKPLVIPKQENSSWRDQILAKRKRPTLIPGPGSLSAPMETIVEPVKVIEHGLQLTKRIKIDHPIQDTDMGSEASNEIAMEEDAAAEQKEETLDELAARKIIEAASGENMAPARKLVLSGQENVQAGDVEAFQKNLDELPDEASLDDYANVPVEEFGAALLRGMGWKGDAKGNDAIEYNRRPALLGLGAKPKEPEAITKKYIKPGESRTPQAIKVPERNRTGRTDYPSLRDEPRRDDGGRGSRDHRDGQEGRDRNDGRSSRDSKGSRDSRESRDNRDSRDSRDRRSSDDNRRSHEDRDGGRDSSKSEIRDSREGRDQRDSREYRGSSERREDRHSRSSNDDRGSRRGYDGGDRRRDRSRDSRSDSRRERDRR